MPRLYPERNNNIRKVIYLTLIYSNYFDFPNNPLLPRTAH